jgi:hypothetical protein
MLATHGSDLFKAFRILRKSIADVEDKPPCVVFFDASGAPMAAKPE